MAKITDIDVPWRKALLPARFRNAYFHVESGSRENGRRIVVHEFPKKELPYAEDMGRTAIAFTVRAYCITYPRDIVGPGLELYRKDYRVARDLLMDELEKEGTGDLQLPTLPRMRVVVTRYRLTEEQKAGGFCVFDIGFVEAGAPPFKPIISSADALKNSADKMRDQTVVNMEE